MTVIDEPSATGRLLPLIAGTGAAVAAAALLALRLAGHDDFPTDPAGVLALAASAAGAAVAATRLTESGNRAAGTLAGRLCAALLAYLALAGWAVWAVEGADPSSALAVTLWSSAWIPPLALLQLVASTAVRAGERTPWTHRAVIWVIAAVTCANALLTTPGEPFAGLPTIAPESWRTALEPIGVLATLAGVLALLLLPVTLWRAALSSAGSARARIAVAAAGTSGAPLTVCFCLLLAVARDPGAVTPALGSAAFLVALAGAAAFSTACALLAARGGVEPRQVLIVIRGTGLAAAFLVVTAIGTIIAAPGVRLGATPVALLIAAVTLAVVGGAWTGTARLARLLTAEDDRPAPPGALPAAAEPVAVLTPREAEVLAALAEGASNAGIAAQLVVSERTIDAHLRAIFVKLGLQQEAGANRRVQAARMWLDGRARAKGP
ncbi:LuxR C-terminal-related transcriptional regulator [Nonomuraea sp. MCN248]|uniref:LuxR C-terminal-related transcriptional regulator n=1 Tax=Nonomuraea corallina TaxID=2989783 RepID=A0ABT4SAR0_9ACTN|nr:LuxR C-terminal-related transcriptional regulator [Nonomuraea corallina]MDA0634035.1 LuxR C-terminal-related transcriptional regulator [Nonomuraea corallina]